MEGSAIQHKSNQYCNLCFEQRAELAIKYREGWNDALQSILKLVEEKEGYPGTYTYTVSKATIEKQIKSCDLWNRP